MAGVTLEQNPNIAALLDEDLGEELSDLRRLGPEEILLRWINFHLANDKSYVELERPKITNFKGDLQGEHMCIDFNTERNIQTQLPTSIFWLRSNQRTTCRA